MRPQAYQTPEIRDENDFIIQQGTFGKKTPFVNSQNDGILDYIINNLVAIKGVSLAATIVVSSLPSTGLAENSTYWTMGQRIVVRFIFTKISG